MELINHILLIDQIRLDNDICNEIKLYYTREYLYDIAILITIRKVSKEISTTTNFINMENILKMYPHYMSISIILNVKRDADNRYYIANIMKNKLNNMLHNKNIIIEHDKHNKYILRLEIKSNYS